MGDIVQTSESEAISEINIILPASFAKIEIFDGLKLLKTISPNSEKDLAKR